MNDNAEAKQNQSEPNSSDSPAKNEESIGEVIKNIIEDKDNNKDLYETLSGLGFANIFIDSRSGGNYFYKQVDIDGNIISNDPEKSLRNPVKKTSVNDLAGQIFKQEIRKINSVYIETLNYSDFKHILQENHLLILWGNLGFGKRATAIHLIFSLLKSEDIFEVDPSLELDELKKFQGGKNQGYILDQLTSETAEKLDRFSLKNLSNQLRNKKSFLVIIISRKIKLSLTDLSPYIITCNDFPKPNDLFKKHLIWYLETPSLPSKALELIQNSSVQELLQNNKLLPADLDLLAELLSKSYKGELTFDQALSRFSVIVNQQIESWFDVNLDLTERAFMICLAVLNHSPYQLVVEASKNLQSIIQGLSDDGKSLVPDSKLSTRLAKFSADLIQDYKNTEYGKTSVELIVFKNPVFQPAVLSYVWQQYDQYRSPILSWLNELGKHANSEIRLKASAAVGELCKYDFDLVQKNVLLPWAKHQDQNLQMLAALALSIPVFDGSHAPQVLKLLHHWSSLKNDQLRWTATVAYGGYVGLRFPEIALRDLLAIAELKDGLLFYPVVQSLINLFEMGKFQPNQYSLVLTALQSWTENTKKTISHYLGLVTFCLLMSNSQVTENPSTKNWPWPSLLWLIKENDLYQDIISCLVRRALNLQETRLSTLEAIHNWLKRASEDHRLYPLVGQIIYDIVDLGDRREKDRIITYLKKWSAAKPPSENAAWKILSVLTKHGKV